MVDSYHNFFCIAGHKLLAYPLESDEPSRSDHCPKGDK
jgi:hypothetical protein